MAIEIITRAAWGARPPKRRHLIDTPTPELWLHHTAGSSTGPAGMRAIQAYHMDARGWTDIAYSYVVDPQALTVYEGRGAGVAGGHTAGRNHISHAICVMGNYDDQGVTNGLLDLLVELVDHGHRKGWWPAQITGGHRDASGASTACPGRHLQAAIPAINTRTPGGPMPADTPPADWAAAIADTEYYANLWDLQNVLKAHAGYEGALDRLPGPLTKEAWHRLKNSRDLWRDKHDKLEDLLVAAEQRIAELEARQQDDEGTINELREQVEGLQQDLAGCQADLDAAVLAEGVNWANVRALLDRLDEEIGHPDD